MSDSKHADAPATAAVRQNVSQLLATCQRHDDGVFTAELSPDWLQGRSAYGGIQAALAVEAMLPFSGGLPIRTLQATLCAPVPDGTLRFEARLLRAGGNTRQIEARLIDDGSVLALFVGIFGRARASEVAHDLVQPDLTGQAGTRMPFVEGMPAFLKQFSASIIKGHFPGSGTPDTEHVYRISLHDDAERTGLPQMLAMTDFPPPVGLSWLKRFTPGSTMTWMLNFTGHPFADQPLADWVIDVKLDAAHDGYTQQTVTLFAPDGYAVARGTQCMVIFG